MKSIEFSGIAQIILAIPYKYAQNSFLKPDSDFSVQTQNRAETGTVSVLISALSGTLPDAPEIVFTFL